MLRIPSKGQALAYAICLAGLSFVLFAANAATCAFPFLLVALGYGGVWFYKFQKDQHIVRRARRCTCRTPRPLAAWRPRWRSTQQRPLRAAWTRPLTLDSFP